MHANNCSEKERTAEFESAPKNQSDQRTENWVKTHLKNKSPAAKPRMRGIDNKGLLLRNEERNTSKE